ncbi:hypothetical protein LFU01_43680 [Lysinibacillus fusiformis]|nr:hypothetical protein LFU01_43680 [Lysinibacillus fusiformis]
MLHKFLVRDTNIRIQLTEAFNKVVNVTFGTNITKGTNVKHVACFVIGKI